MTLTTTDDIQNYEQSGPERERLRLDFLPDAFSTSLGTSMASWPGLTPGDGFTH